MKKIYVVAAILSVITGITVYSYVSSLEGKGEIEYTQVVVANTFIPERTLITVEMLTVKKIPAEAVLPNTLKSPEYAVGYISAGIFESGEQISAVKIHSGQDRSGKLSYFVPSGKRAITIDVDMVTGIGGYVLPGDRVDIIATMMLEHETEDSDEKRSLSTTFLICQNVEVLASGTRTKVDSGIQNLSYNNVTLALSPDDALAITFASSGGRLRLILRNPADEDDEEVKPVNSINLDINK